MSTGQRARHGAVQSWPNLPIGAMYMPGYMEAVERAEGCCEHMSKPLRQFEKPRRCTKSLNGGHRLYLTVDDQLLCQTHFDRDRLDRRKAKR